MYSLIKDDPKVQDENFEMDRADESTHWRGNCTKTGYIVYTVSSLHG